MDVPEVVKAEMKKNGLPDRVLIDKQDCEKRVCWIAIPAGIPVNVPRPPGYGHLVCLDIDGQTVHIEGGQ